MAAGYAVLSSPLLVNKAPYGVERVEQGSAEEEDEEGVTMV